jgi:hypothetical protein
MGPVRDHVSAPEGRRVPSQLSATEIARLVTDEAVSTIISSARSQEGVLLLYVQDKINAVKDTFAASLSGIEQELDRTLAVNPHHEELRAAAGDNEKLTALSTLSAIDLTTEEGVLGEQRDSDFEHFESAWAAIKHISEGAPVSPSSLSKLEQDCDWSNQTPTQCSASTDFNWQDDVRRRLHLWRQRQQQRLRDEEEIAALEQTSEALRSSLQSLSTMLVSRRTKLKLLLAR